LGVVLYELLTGQCCRTPGEHEAALLYAIVHERSDSALVAQAGYPGAVSSLMSKVLQKNPALRYQTAQELIRRFGEAESAELPAAAERTFDCCVALRQLESGP